MIDFEDRKKYELEEKEYNNRELIIIFRKNSYIKKYVSKMFDNDHLRTLLLNRDIITDTFRDYILIYSNDTNVQEILRPIDNEPIQDLQSNVIVQ